MDEIGLVILLLAVGKEDDAEEILSALIENFGDIVLFSSFMIMFLFLFLFSCFLFQRGPLIL